VRYRTIVADPPWEYDEGFPSGVARPDGSLERWTYELPYDAMTFADIAAIPVRDWADVDGARIFLWTTNKYLPRSYGLLTDGWGFTYGQTIVWAKTSHVPPFATSIAPQASEYLLYGYCGKPPARTGNFPSTVIASPRGFTSHSRKPEGFLDLIESTCPGPYLEMFARRNRIGWDTWGDEALAHVELTT
jgi:N6-adenosine-specific RNA methylase IME4